MSYEEALNHLVQCPLEEVFCPFDCYEKVEANLIEEAELLDPHGQKYVLKRTMMRKDIDEHLKNCPA